MACLSLAAKMEEPLVPSFLDLQVTLVYISTAVVSEKSFHSDFGRKLKWIMIDDHRSKEQNIYLNLEQYVGWSFLCLQHWIGGSDP